MCGIKFLNSEFFVTSKYVIYYLTFCQNIFCQNIKILEMSRLIKEFVIIYLDGHWVWSRHRYWHFNGDRDRNRLLYGNRDRLGLDHGVGLWHRNGYWNCVRDGDRNLKITKNSDCIIYWSELYNIHFLFSSLR